MPGDCGVLWTWTELHANDPKIPGCTVLCDCAVECLAYGKVRLEYVSILMINTLAIVVQLQVKPLFMAWINFV